MNAKAHLLYQVDGGLWAADDLVEQRFKRILTRVSLVALVMAVFFTFLKPFHIEKEKKEVDKPRLVKLLAEKKPPPPPPKPKPPQVAKAKPKPKPKPPPKVKAKPQPNVAKMGLLAMSSELVSLKESPTIRNIEDTRPLRTGNRTVSKRSSRSIVSDPTRSSGGIDTSKQSRDVGGRGLKGHQTAKIKTPIEGISGSPDGGSPRGGKKTKRSVADVQLFLQKQQSKFDRLYRRALRMNSELQGQVVIEFIIQPSGKVTNVRILSSELKDPSMERKIVAIFSTFNFGRQSVDALPYRYPLDFVPET